MMLLSGCGESWPDNSNGSTSLGGAPASEFPEALDQWRLEEVWSDMPRAFVGEELSAVLGADRKRFPATMNGCDAQRFPHQVACSRP